MQVTASSRTDSETAEEAAPEETGPVSLAPWAVWPQAVPRTGASSGLKVQRTVLAITFLFWALLLLMAGVYLWHDRQAALLQGRADLERAFAVSEAEINRTLLSLDVLQSGLQELPVLDAQAGETQVSQLMHQWLRAAARQNLVVRSIYLLDGQRQIQASSEQEQPSQALAEAPWMQRIWEQGGYSTDIALHPGLNGADENSLYFTRLLTRPDGQRWLAVVEVSLDALQSQISYGVSLRGMELTLETEQGEMLVAVPGAGHWQPASGAPLPRLQHQQGGVLSQDWQMPSRLSLQPGMTMVRSLYHPRLWLSASLPQTVALEVWEPRRNLLLLSVLLFGALAVAAAWLGGKYASRMLRAQKELLESRQTLVQALESMVTGFVQLDGERRVIHWNSRFLSLFPWVSSVIRPQVPFREILETSSRMQLPKASKEERERWIARRLELQNQLRDSVDAPPHEQWLPSGRCVQITERGLPEGGWVIVYHDVTELRQASAEIESLAYYDALTGLPNRRMLLDRVDHMARRLAGEGHSAAILFLDLDQFKKLNDTQGHELGDALLRQVGERLRNNVRSSDVVARLGGDEFVILLHHLSADGEAATEEARRVGNALLDVLSKPYELGSMVHYCSCSMGVALFRDASLSAAELLRQADIAMYEVKGQRGNGLRFYDPQMQANLRQRAAMEADLQLALERNEFELHYQPQYTLSGQLLGAEALVRWRHPVRGMVSPGAFIPVAEESELILALGRWVLRAACEQLVAWRQDPALARLHLSVNVSARQFHQPDFTQEVVGIVQDSGIRAHLLKIELTESLVLEDVEETIAVMHALRTKGIRFAVDDFGTGYSSLAYLSRLPLNELKIDQSFVRNIGEHYNDDVIVQTIIGMARNLDLEVVAEGVETVAQRDYLARHGCDTYQGYLFGRPMPAADFETMARRANEGGAANA